MVVLLTDFGLSEYVGVMKAIVYGVDKDAKIVDLCHDIRPQSIIEAAWILKNNYRYFPKSSVFCCVVDPGVGTARKALAVKTGSYYFVAPDNGLLWESVKEQTVLAIRELPIPLNASKTFHGRDVFAKAAAQINIGKFDDLGEEMNQLKKFELYRSAREGIVVRIDRFGNIITNLPAESKQIYTVRTAAKLYQMNFHPYYKAAAENELFLIKGSYNTLEISLKDGDANAQLDLEPGQRITIS
jgi:S-adenosylmethionine hydrolase